MKERSFYVDGDDGITKAVKSIGVQLLVVTDL